MPRIDRQGTNHDFTCVSHLARIFRSRSRKSVSSKGNSPIIARFSSNFNKNIGQLEHFHVNKVYTSAKM
jgi:hypothetical protein